MTGTRIRVPKLSKFFYTDTGIFCYQDSFIWIWVFFCYRDGYGYYPVNIYLNIGSIRMVNIIFGYRVDDIR
jgi:hypothetical protein